MRTPRQLIHVSPLALIAAVAIAILALPATGTAQTDRAPVVTAPALATTQENTPLTIIATAADPDGDAITSFTASGTAINGGGTFTSNTTHTSGTFSWTPSFAQAGLWNVTFTALNALTGTATTSITVGGPDRAPVVTAPSSVSGVPNSLITFTVSAADPDGEAITSLTAAPLPAGATFTSNASHTAGTFSWTPTFAQTGNFNITFTASNTLSGSKTTQITVFAGGDRAPAVTAPATAQAIIGVPMSFTVSAGDPDGDAIASLTASGTAMTAGGTFTSNATHTAGTFAWTAGFGQEGSYSAVFTAANALSGSATTSITVCACDRAPVVTAPATVIGAPNTLITFTVAATDPDGDAITSLSAAPLAMGMAFTSNASNTSGTFSWTPVNAQSGTFNVTFTATNALSGTATTQINTVVGDRAPVVSAPASISVSVGSPVTFTVSASDPDGDAITSLTASGSAVDAGGTFTAGTGNTSGTFTWTPDLAESGTFVATFRATNALQGTASTQIYVSPNPSARAFTLGSNKTIRLNSSKPLWCAFVEPLGGSFSVLDIDLASVVLRSTGTGSVPEIPANILKSVVVSDADKNNIQDVEFCFTKDNLRLLFGNLNGRNTVDATIAGRLMNLTPFSASIQIDVIAGGNSLAASISPNPLNPSGTISFTVPSAGVARVRIFDASGRLVKTLAEAPLGAGRHDMPFDVRDASGSRPASGVYFYRVDVAGEFATGRFVVTR